MTSHFIKCQSIFIIFFKLNSKKYHIMIVPLNSSVSSLFEIVIMIPHCHREMAFKICVDEIFDELVASRANIFIFGMNTSHFIPHNLKLLYHVRNCN